VRAEQNVAQLVGRYGFYSTPVDLVTAYCSQSGNANGIVRYYMARAYSERIPDGICQELREAAFRR
jgi:hypothetical protein